MSNIVIQNLQELVFDQFNLAKVSRNVRLIHNKQNININTHVLYMPFNLSKYKKQWSNFEEYSVDCYVQDVACSEKLSQFDDYIFDLSKKNSQLFNVQNLNDASYSPMYRENKTYPKLLKLYLPRDNNGNFTTQFFDDKSEKIIVDENNIETILSKKTMFKCIITCSKVWYYQNKIGSIWNIVQLKMVSNDNKNSYNNSDNSCDSELSENDGSESDDKMNKNSIYTQSLID